VVAVAASTAAEWIVTARERLASAPPGRSRAAVLAATLLEVSTTRTGGDAPQDRGTKLVLVGSVVAALLFAALLATTGPALPGGGWPAVIAGCGLVVCGGGLRAWGIATLGSFFRRDVTIQPNHRVISSGPYRLLRHPAYAGNLLASTGFGLALGSVLSLLVMALVPLLGHLPRIVVEEHAMERALGRDWRAYAADTARLVPGVW
jgi:protein-S-isoprenylcysteine O-methyltransferase